MAQTIHPVDEVLPIGQMLAVGIQHVLVMYAGAIAVPLIIGAALKLPKDQVAFLISSDLFACGLVTLVQCIGVWKFGIRLPVIMGVSFAPVGPMVAMASSGAGLTTIFGATIAAGVFAILIAPFFGRLMRFFPPLVTGTIILTIGMTLFPVAINWAGGGRGAANFGEPRNLMIAATVLLAIMIINK
jgi:xanthine/uracil permease